MENSINAGFGIPLEYQSQLEALAQRRKLAQALQAQSLQPIQVPQYGPMASKLSPLAPLGQALATYLNQKNINSAEAEQTKVLGEAEAGGQAEMGQVMGVADPQARIAAALASRYPGVRQQGSTWQKSRDARVLEAGKAILPQDPTAGMGILQSGNFPETPYAPPPPKPVQFGVTPDATQSPYALFEQPGGKREMVPFRQPSVISQTTRLPGAEGVLELERESKDLTARQAAAQAAMQDLATNQRLVKLYEQGLRTGGGESAYQVARQVGAALGVDLPATGMTDAARTLLGERLLDRAKTLGSNPSNADRDVIAKIVGSIDTDPNAVAQLIAWSSAKSLKTLQDFNQFVGIKRGNARLPGLYETADVGIRAPSQLFGPQELQYRMLEALQQEGGDLSQFQDATGPISPNATFKFGPKAAIPSALPPGITPIPRRR